MRTFEQFPVYIAAEELYTRLHPVMKCRTVPMHLRNQLDRAASSIALNIAEGAGKFSSREKKKFYLTSRASAQESLAIVRLMMRREYISQSEYEDLVGRLNTICRMLSGLINYMLGKMGEGLR